MMPAMHTHRMAIHGWRKTGPPFARIRPLRFTHFTWIQKTTAQSLNGGGPQRFKIRADAQSKLMACSLPRDFLETQIQKVLAIAMNKPEPGRQP